MNENMIYWDAVEKTDPKYTKAANVGGNKQTSINAVYMAKVATELFGPIGIGWGYEVAEERYENTRPVMVRGESCLEILMDGDSIVWEQNHTIRIDMWIQSREHVFTQFGHTKSRYMKADGSKMIIDDEAPKKSLTDAMKKCLSLVGICSDVFMGEFDDRSYVDAAQLESDLKKADDKDAEYASKLDQFKAYIEDKLKAMDQCPTPAAMSSVYGLAVRKIDREAPILGLDPASEKQALDAKYHEINNRFNKG
jgi:hypothetical protein